MYIESFVKIVSKQIVEIALIDKSIYNKIGLLRIMYPMWVGVAPA
jgi:hypothetical protein